jgi:hypothetical protein
VARFRLKVMRGSPSPGANEFAGVGMLKAIAAESTARSRMIRRLRMVSPPWQSIVRQQSWVLRPSSFNWAENGLARSSFRLDQQTGALAVADTVSAPITESNGLLVIQR